ncbi:MAG TPA: hypothetical protein VEC14_15425, partial [Reyranellaceae bacterium]|nr:hypothetical protein [Reyranellaceae bacterium]
MDSSMPGPGLAHPTQAVRLAAMREFLGLAPARLFLGYAAWVLAFALTWHIRTWLPVTLVAGLFLVAAVGMALQHWAFPQRPRNDDEVVLWAHIRTVLSVFWGLGWAGPVMLIVTQPPSIAWVLPLLTLSVAVGLSIAHHSRHPPSAYAFLFSALVPATLATALSPYPGVWSLAVAGVLYAVALVLSCRAAHA